MNLTAEPSLFDDLPTAQEAEEDQRIDPPIVRSMVSAAGCPMPETVGAPSVFGLASARFEWREGVPPAPSGRRGANVRVVTRTEGVTRCTTVPFAETEQAQEREQKRRARQEPPKPNKQDFKMKNSKTWEK